jgi:hypothetical protein
MNLVEIGPAVIGKDDKDRFYRVKEVVKTCIKLCTIWVGKTIAVHLCIAIEELKSKDSEGEYKEDQKQRVDSYLFNRLDHCLV